MQKITPDCGIFRLEYSLCHYQLNGPVEIDMRYLMTIPLLTISVALPVMGEEPFFYISGAGHAYTLDCNRNGYVLTSVNPVGRRIGEDGASIQTIYDTETIYLGASCDAYSELLGNGEWAWANGGFIVDFGDFRIGFPRYELQCPTTKMSYRFDDNGSCLSQ